MNLPAMWLRKWLARRRAEIREHDPASTATAQVPERSSSFLADSDDQAVTIPLPPDRPAPRPQAGPIRPGPPARFFTPAALRRAWLAIKRAGGGAGVDGVTLTQFAAHLDEELDLLQAELASGNYRPRPMRQVLVPKSSGGLRPLVIWALRDRVAQRLMYDLLAPTFDSDFLPCSFGFRPGLGVADAIEAVVRYRNENLRWVVVGDIENCFEAINSRRLLPLVARRVHDRLLLTYIRRWLESDLLNSADGAPRKSGTSQGSALSPLLANIYLHQVDRELLAQRLAYARYADNFVICCRRKDDAETARDAAGRALARVDMAINAHKTHIVHFDQGFAWLGYFLVANRCYRL